MRPEHIANYVDKADVYAYGEATQHRREVGLGKMGSWANATNSTKNVELRSETVFFF